MSNKARRALGLLFGGVIGLIYGLVSQYINSLIMPDIPFYAPPPGQVGALLFFMLGGAILGLITSWPEEALGGIAVSALVGAIATTIISARTQASNQLLFVRTLIFLSLTFLPTVIVFLPLVGLLRWATHIWEQETLYNPYSLRKRINSLLILLIPVAAGLISIYPKDVRQAFTDMNALVQSAIQANSLASLPEPLKKLDQFGILQNAAGSYTLEYRDNPDLLAAQRPVAAPGVTESLIIAHFQNGFSFGCVYTPPNPDPVCWLWER